MVVSTCPIYKEGICALGGPFQLLVLLYDDSYCHWVQQNFLKPQTQDY